MLKHRKLSLLTFAALGLFGCAKEEESSDCVLNNGATMQSLEGTCCTPERNGTPITNNGNPIDGVCNAANLCQYGWQPDQQAPGVACGAPNAPDQGRTINPDRDMGAMGGGMPPVGGEGGGGGAAPVGGDNPPVGGAPPPVGGEEPPVGGQPGNPCDGVSCSVGERCVEGVCISNMQGEIAGSCTDDAQCPDMDCTTEVESEGGTPGGFCRSDCRSDRDCGAGLRCLAAGQATICFASCEDTSDCRDGWTCASLGDGTGGACSPDCRVVGCGRGQVCNDNTGMCDVGCPYACDPGEECSVGHCVRLDGSCTTSYHCATDTEECHEGRCGPAQFTDCTADPAACSPSQTCVNAGTNSICLYSCADDTGCPADQICLADLAVCYYAFCGPGDAMRPANGEVFGACAAGGQQQWEGTCLPLAVGTDLPGICLEAGNVAEGQACNDQSDGRDAAARNEQCGSGMLCMDDPDDPLDPDQRWNNTGICSEMCDPRQGACDGGQSCIDFSQGDDPQTLDFDETRVLGTCRTSDCSAGTGGAPCGAGRQCRPFGLIDDLGACGPAGVAAANEACRTNVDCADEAFCGNPGGGNICIKTCDEQNPDCPEGTMCVNNGWGYALCL